MKAVIEANYIITELLDIIRNSTKENEIKYICEVLRGLEDTYWKEDIEETIKSLSSIADICPKCGGEYKYKYYYEKHYELDGNDLEEIGHFECENCGYNPDED